MAKANDADEIRATLIQLAGAHLSPKEMLKQARKAHPKASKKQIIHSAFGTLIAIADSDGDRAKALHEFALSQRGDGD